VGESLAGKLQKLGITVIQDLLFLLPLRYEDRTCVVPIGALRFGDRAVVEGEVQLAEVSFRGRRQLLCKIGDGSGFLTLRFFYFSNSQQQALIRGKRIRCYGEIRRGLGGLEIVHPEYRLLAADTVAEVEPTLTPIYPLTEGVQQGRLRQLTELALRDVANRTVRDWLPASVLEGMELPPLREALEYVHRPPPDASLELLSAGKHPAQRRLAFEELLAHQLSLRLLRKEIQCDPGWPLLPKASLVEKFLAGLPFRLTDAAAGARRCRQRQDGGGRDGRTASGGSRLSGRGDGADRIAGRTARPEFCRVARTSRYGVGIPHWQTQRRRSHSCARGPRFRAGANCRGHARAVPGACGVQAAGACDHR
jgi:ATP-dependent DNA helicase RecG